MSSSHRRQGSSQSTSSGHSHQQSHDSFESHLTHSTAPTSLYSTQDHYFSDHKTMGTSTRADEDLYTPSSYYHSQPKPYVYQDDVSPATSLYPRSSVETYASTTSSSQDLDAMDLDDESPVETEDVSIPPLPTYRRELVEPNVRATTPQDFAKLFPSLNRLSIRHDEYTSDGNMNLRIDTVVTGRRRTVYQLFHLRMYDLAKREFSLRRYCRDSGREVCNSKRKYAESSASVKAKSRATSKDDVNTSKSHHERPTLKRSMSTAIKTLSAATKSKPALRRTTTSGAASICSSRPNTSDSCYGGDELCRHSNSSRTSLASKGKGHRAAIPTNTIKLEFSNYARVDVHRRGGKSNKRYEFEWWGHNYAWKRSVDKQMGGQVSFHLIRDGNTSAPVAHIVPETRSPAQVDADERAGGWVPPCFMWIADETIIDAVTDVADVIMASGLMALVDDCIKEKWQTSKKVHRIPLPLTHRTVSLPSIDASPRSIMQHVFGRRHSQTQSHQPTPMRLDQPIAAC
ncbi:hypothetical protein B0T20DRAFT_206558 [Sordaria brevicollis]|uniref:Uncharacterized protein n=1 Tax=Sordaria brevicollis TaxID=83679 RepID=A0AAE0PEL3_SORBR|nr:hypothetical protein B0T20DRAFT_206558 [Sordaria brevicollis]